MKSNIYEYRDYKKYLIDLIESDPAGGRGRRKELAEAINCQVSHITNVLSGTGHFNQEQAEATARFFGFSFQETEFLLLLVQYNRAGTQSLKRFYERTLDSHQEKYSALKNRLKMPDSLQSQDEIRYYSSWYFSAIHVLLSIPQFQTREAIAKKLELPLAKVDEVLMFLVDTGLGKKEGQHYLIGRSQLHLDKASPLISRHHTNWRLQSIRAFDRISSEHLHYSSVFTLSKKDYSHVKEILTKALAEALEVITLSPEENVAALCLDLFNL